MIHFVLNCGVGGVKVCDVMSANLEGGYSAVADPAMKLLTELRSVALVGPGVPSGRADIVVVA